MIWLSTVWPDLRCDVELAGQNGQPQQHGAQDRSEQELGALGPGHPGLLEQGHAVGDGLDPGQGTAPGRERLEHQQDRDRFDGAGGHQRVPGLRLTQAQGVDQADGNDGQQPDDEDEGRDEKGTGPLPQPAEIEHGDDQEDAQAHRDHVGRRGGKGRGQLTDAGGDGDGHGEGVVDDQRRSRPTCWPDGRSCRGRRRRRLPRGDRRR